MDAYEQALVTDGLLGNDHRWRVEHVGGCRGDLLDGQLYPTEVGSQWMRAGDAFTAPTINAASQLGRDHDLVSLAVGKLTEQVSVLGTWVNSRKTDTEAFVAQVAAMDPAEHKGLPATAITHRC